MKLLPFLSITALLLGSSVCADTPPSPPRPASWAEPLQANGVPNFYKVSDTLYRSAQPTAEGMRNLKAMGIKTIVNLRSFHSDRGEIEKSGLGYEHIFMKAWHPEEKEAIHFLRIVTDSNRSPILVHCQHGADRTGIMCALYRVCVQGWSKEEAITEMTEGGFGFHGIWANLVQWMDGFDSEGIKKQIEIKHDIPPAR